MKRILNALFTVIIITLFHIFVTILLFYFTHITLLTSFKYNMYSFYIYCYTTIIIISIRYICIES